jgi:hypothetical protein
MMDRVPLLIRLAAALAGATLLMAGNCAVDACSADTDCPEGAACVAAESGALVCSAACSAVNPCPDGEACTEVEGATICVPAGEGELGDTCDDNAQCASGACVLAGETSVCVVLCEDDNDCAQGARCYTTDLARVCLTPVDDRGVGEACSSPPQCDSGLCAGQPGDDATCVARCEADGSCPGGTLCADLVSGERACLRGLEDGEACNTPDLCKSGRCVADENGARICTRACPGWDCDTGWSCVPSLMGDRICMPNTDSKATGESCSSARECVDPFCINFGEEHGVRCAPACEQNVLCDTPLMCWEVDEQPNVCGPAF